MDEKRCSPSAGECTTVANSWNEWSVTLGLKEDNAKSQFYHKKLTGRAKLFTTGIDENQIASQPKILGVVLVPSHGRRLAPSEEQRLDLAKQVLHKVRCLPVNLSTTLRVACASAVSKASYGRQCRLPSLVECRNFSAALARACRISPQSEPEKPFAWPSLFSLFLFCLGPDHHVNLENDQEN